MLEGGSHFGVEMEVVDSFLEWKWRSAIFHRFTLGVEMEVVCIPLIHVLIYVFYTLVANGQNRRFYHTIPSCVVLCGVSYVICTTINGGMCCMVCVYTTPNSTKYVKYGVSAVSCSGVEMEVGADVKSGDTFPNSGLGQLTPNLTHADPFIL